MKKGVYVLPYDKGSYASIAGALGAWNSPRAHYRYTQVLYQVAGEHTLILAHAQLSPHLKVLIHFPSVSMR